jgi:glycosyltransferase involved in cell wall biosynthesis
VRGFGRHRARFAVAALALAPRTRWTYVGHVALAPLALAIRAARPRSRYWVAIHGVEVWKRLTLPERLGLRAATGINSVSRYTADRAAELHGLDASRIRILPNALDPEWRLADAASDGNGRRNGGSLTLLTVGRLKSVVQYKGVDTVIEALPRLVRELPTVRYVVVGDGDDRPRLEQLAARLGVADRVQFHGRLSEAELRRTFENCEVYVMPSRGEGFGVVYLEAMSLGKPVVGGAHGGAPEVVVDGVTGFLVEHGDVDLLADRLMLLLRDENLRRRMGETGRQRVEDQFTFPRFSENLTDILREVGAPES